MNKNIMRWRLNTLFVCLLSLILIGCSKQLPAAEGIVPDTGEEPEPDFTVKAEASIPLPAYYAGMNGRSTEGPSWTNPTFLALVEQMSPGCIRYPGGTQGNSWDWRMGGLMHKTNPKFPYFIPDLVKGLPQTTDIIYVMNMARPTAATGYTGNEPIEVLKSVQVLQAKITDALAALAEFERHGRLPIALELGNEFYFDNEHAAIYAADHELYMHHASIIAHAVKAVYPAMKILLCTTKGGTRGRDKWNAGVYARLAADAGFKALVHGVVQHHYISENYGSQSPIATVADAEAAIAEGWSYADSVKSDYRHVPPGLKLWLTEYGISKKPEEGGMWAVGLQYAALAMGFLQMGEKVENILCQHITLSRAVINLEQMKLGPVGVAYGALMAAANGGQMARPLTFVARNPADGAEKLHGLHFRGASGETLLLMNASARRRTGIDLKGVVAEGAAISSMVQYWSETPYMNPVTIGNGILSSTQNAASATNKPSEKGVDALLKYVLEPFSLSLIRLKSAKTMQ